MYVFPEMGPCFALWLIFIKACLQNWLIYKAKGFFVKHKYYSVELS